MPGAIPFPDFGDPRMHILGWCAIPSTVTAEVMAGCGFDAMVIDMQHGLIGYDMALTMLQVMQGRGHAVMCRLGGNDAAEISRMLDAGFAGLICPAVETGADAERFVRAASFPPQGARSFGAARAAAIYGPDYVRDADRGLCRLAMIGSARAAESIDDILATPGLAGVYVAVADLSLSMGFGPSQLMADVPVRDAVTAIGKAAQSAGKIAGFHAGSVASPAALQGLGYRFAALMTDQRMFSAAIGDQLAAARAA